MKKIIFLLWLIFCVWPISSLSAVDYGKIDRYAKDAPLLKNNDNLNRLVKYLVQPYKTDVEKARVLLAWIVYNIDYDGYKLNAMENMMNGSKKRNRQLFIPDNDILETRLGVCGDIAELYQKMGAFADLKIALIYGKVKQPGDNAVDFTTGVGHVWTAVKINGSWQFVDPTFAIQGNTSILEDVERKREYQRIIRQRSKRNSSAKKPRNNRYIDEQWFLTKNTEMIKTHFPDDERWQLLPNPVSEQEFLGLGNRDYKNLQKQTKKVKQKRGF